ncbi:MAG: bifunctional 5,10-methylene-tetrahydrofolate dehydrogenase/5,10-methylene-tetrahydrofolate cyclohydrolase [Sphingobacteriia bacterium 24-36-13]|jgi:methylenetetrahydrofolate dehydrogenase (NADP+)/methenyltetrahydrofolate cyclohydrolase|uniref:bifunctional 5,10-methylenetetrahydrofolate dehydrogenase/5,10-methenyltetrahydrofolate cyclohydrolase n=1 Tax=Sediminibacterium sp. TaxID=1917865 RepID=UPI000BDA11D6|nr:tetrahydrofolate dehydrogenase/cyclohydrolase catalytic domain-containing protein [Sediminibacterium sp.]OYY09712.1 MAG: bifunctional 5,10-methylene-tetrahydrofolate dehydrogenase/5,10-methylene-tetrahydrofolate cyclohydrolase [Sphingobacteriia bacterium 35-36-14]OYZ55062.1 MAG: bifunctional 5,10-methylene-tetrahydrofolate dehydrogenase/5,10-methylene-tetrahydrofolate cyclohydrolase [Sphingobacteriia bacterium 24-36-13]OZA66410.1 MAG: bifunctional 5,10-methylene-tetrahydrofolate dehydrogenase
MLVLDGKLAAAAVKEVLKAETAELVKKGKPAPHLAAILVGNNGASETYVASKVKNCEETGFESTLIRLPVDTTETILLETIQSLNNNPDIDGILVQLPLPKHISEEKVIETIDPRKDVDGFHPSNIGRLVQGLPTFIPATPYGILLLLAHFNIDTKGKHAVVIGRSNIVGRPMSILLSSNIPQGNCTVTLCHSHTPNLKELCLQADIVVAALGKPEFVTADMVKDGAVIIDVGITRVEDATAKKGFRIKGDVQYQDVAPKASAITPVPGGVGLMTIAGLLKNTLQAYQNNRG